MVFKGYSNILLDKSDFCYFIGIIKMMYELQDPPIEELASANNKTIPPVMGAMLYMNVTRVIIVACIHLAEFGCFSVSIVFIIVHISFNRFQHLAQVWAKDQGSMPLAFHAEGHKFKAKT